MTINGFGFASLTSAGNVVVKLASADCNIITLTPNQIVCRVGRQRNAVQGGSRGWLQSVYPGAAAASKDPNVVFPSLTVPDNTKINAGVLSGSSVGSIQNYAATYTAYFVPPITANYSFYVSGDGYGDILLSSDGSAANATTIASVATASNNILLWRSNIPCNSAVRYNCYQFQQSQSIRMLANQKYYFQARSLYGTSTSFPFSVAMRIATSSPNPAVQRYQSTPAIKKVQLNQTFVMGVQEVRVWGVRDGTFSMTFPPRLSNNIRWNATAAEFRSAIANANPCGWAVSVTSTPYSVTLPSNSTAITGYTWTVTYNCFLTSPTVAPLNFYSVSSLKAYDNQTMITSVAVTVPGTAALSGSFTLSWKSNSSPVIDVTANSGTVQSSMLQIPGINNVEVLADGDRRYGLTYYVKFNDPVGPISLGADPRNIVGNSASITITDVQAGSFESFFDPVPADFFEQISPFTSAEVWTQGVKAVCQADRDSFGPMIENDPAAYLAQQQQACGYAYNSSLSFSVSSVTTVAPFQISLDQDVFIRLNVRLDAADSYTVYFTPTASDAYLTTGFSCLNLAVSGTQLKCTVGPMPSGNYTISVLHVTRGFGSWSVNNIYRYFPKIGRVFPASQTAGMNGGSSLTIEGGGLDGANVYVGNSLCAITEQTSWYLVCTVPACATPSTSNVSVPFVINLRGGVNTSLGVFTYQPSLTPQITQITPSLVSAAQTVVVTITGTNFFSPVQNLVNADNTTMWDTSDITPNSYSPSYSVRLVGASTSRVCELVSVNDTVIQCRLFRANPDPVTTQFTPELRIKYAGLATVTSDVWVRVQLQVDSVTPLLNGCGGGYNITIAGAGFIPSFPISVSLSVFVPSTSGMLPSNASGSLPAPYAYTALPTQCTVVSQSETQVVCTVERLSVARYATSSIRSLVGAVTVTVNQMTTVCNSWSLACSVVFAMERTPIISGVNPKNIFNGATISISGSKFDVAPLEYISIGSSGSCLPSSVTPTTIRCVTRGITAGTQSVRLFFTGAGFAVSQATLQDFEDDFTVYVNFQVDSISPSAGSMVGGTTVTISGSGFSTVASENYVYIGSLLVAVTSATDAQLVAQLPPLPSFPSGATSIVSNVTVSLMTYDENGAITFLNATTADGISLNFTRSVALAPSITAVTPSSGANGTAVTVTVSSGFISVNRTLPAGTVVMIGNAPCGNITVLTVTTFRCVVGPTPAGRYPIVAMLGSQGYARSGSARFTSSSNITSFTPATGAVTGGDLVVIQGVGFGNETETTVTLGTTTCRVLRSTYSSVTCLTNALLVAETVQFVRSSPAAPVLGVPFISGNRRGDLKSAFDDNLNTWVAVWDNTEQFIGMTYANNTRIWLTGVNVYPHPSWRSAWASNTVEATVDGVNWVQVGQTANLFDTWTLIPISESFNGNTGFSGVRVRCAAGSYCGVFELQFLGYSISTTPVVFPSVSVVSSNPASVAFDQTISPVTVASSSNYTFQPTSTPTITDIRPLFGTALGGSSVTITGTNLASTAEGATVLINGANCSVVSLNLTQIVCVTGPRCGFQPLSTVVKLSTGSSIFSPSVVFRYMDRWSAFTTWSALSPPVAGDTVVIPRGQAVLLDISPPPLFFVLVLGELYFDRRNIQLEASYINVQGGYMEIGTEDQPFIHNATIVLRGRMGTTPDLPVLGAKVLAVTGRQAFSTSQSATALSPCVQTTDSALLALYNTVVKQSLQNDQAGRLEIHGVARTNSAKLARTVEAKNSTITLASPVDWKAGDRIAIPTGSYRTTEAETAFIQSVSANGLVVNLTAPLRFAHSSSIITINGATIDARLPVVLLSRNIIVQGDSSSLSTYFGARTIVGFGGRASIENAEFRLCGQATRASAGCISFMGLNVYGATSYVRGNSFHTAQSRAISIRASHFVSVTNNVAFSVTGHAIALESGNELFNTFSNNTIIGTEINPWETSIGVTAPAGFYAMSPNNKWENNYVSGTKGAAFVWQFPGSAAGMPGVPSSILRAIASCPGGHPLGLFNGNTAFSTSHGLQLLPSTAWTPLFNPCDSSSRPVPAYLRSFTAVNVRGWGFAAHRVGDVHFDQLAMVNSTSGDFRLLRYLANYDTQPAISNSLFVGTTALQLTPSGKVSISLPGDEFFTITNSVFANFYQQPALLGCGACNDPGMFMPGGYTYITSGLTFVNSDVRIGWGIRLNEIFQDNDGTLVGSTGGVATVYYPYIGCPQGGPTLANASVCPATARVRLVRVQSDNWVFNNRPLTLTTSVGNAQFPYRLDAWNFPALAGSWVNITMGIINLRGITVSYSNPIVIQRDQAVMAARGAADGFATADWVGLLFPFTEFRYSYAVTYRGTGGTGTPRSAIDTLPTPNSLFGTGTYMNSIWYVMLSPMNVSLVGTWGRPVSNGLTLVGTPVQCPPLGCPLPPVPTPGNPQNSQVTILWSDQSVWAPPAADEDLEVSANTILVVDVNPPPLATCKFFGTVIIKEGVDITLACQNIIVWGTLSAGSATQPRQSLFELVLRGDASVPNVPVDDSVFTGQKVIAVFGRVELFGNTRQVVSTRLATTAAVGANSITVTTAPDWQNGEEIVIGSTEYSANQVERVTVSSVSDTTVYLQSPLKFTHFAGVVSVPKNGSVTLAPPVALLNRNIVVRSEVAGDNFGPHFYVGDIIRLPSTAIRGTLNLNHVRCNGCGKFDDVYPAVVAKFTPRSSLPAAMQAGLTSAGVAINRCAFTDLRHAGIQALTDDIKLTNNTFYNIPGPAIDLAVGSTAGTISDNVIMSVSRWAASALSFQVLPVATIHLAYVPTQVSGNVVNGANETAFALFPSTCGSNPVYWNNEAQASTYGFFFFSDLVARCAVFSSAVAWKIAHVGFFSVDTNALINLDAVVVADSHIGISLNYFRDNDAGSNFFSVSNSIILGSTAASSCAASVACRSFTTNDALGAGACNSVTPTYRRVGVLTPQFNSYALTCARSGISSCVSTGPLNSPRNWCSRPYDTRHGFLNVPGGQMNIRDTVFAYFSASDCNLKSAALAWNPTQLDYTPAITLSRITWDTTVADDARFQLGPQRTNWRTCTVGKCDGRDQLVITDTDGSTIGSAGGSILSNYSTGYDSTCQLRGSWSAVVCPGLYYRQLIYRNLDVPAGRFLGVIQVSRTTANLTNLVYSTQSEQCGSVATYTYTPMLLLPNVASTIGIMIPPSNSRLTVLTTDPSETFLLSLPYSQPFIVDVYVDQSMVPPNINFTTANATGSNYFGLNNTLSLLLRGNAVPQNVELRVSPMIRLTLTMAISLEDFYGPKLLDNLKTYLGISDSRVKIVSVSAGSTVVEVFIPPSTGFVTVPLSLGSQCVADVANPAFTMEACPAELVTVCNTSSATDDFCSAAVESCIATQSWSGACQSLRTMCTLPNLRTLLSQWVTETNDLMQERELNQTDFDAAVLATTNPVVSSTFCTALRAATAASQSDAAPSDGTDSGTPLQRARKSRRLMSRARRAKSLRPKLQRAARVMGSTRLMDDDEVPEDPLPVDPIDVSDPSIVPQDDVPTGSEEPTEEGQQEVFNVGHYNSMRKLSDALNDANQTFAKITTDKSFAVQNSVQAVSLSVETAGLGVFTPFVLFADAFNSLYGDNLAAPGNAGFYVLLGVGSAVLALVATGTWWYCNRRKKASKLTKIAWSSPMPINVSSKPNSPSNMSVVIDSETSEIMVEGPEEDIMTPSRILSARSVELASNPTTPSRLLRSPKVAPLTPSTPSSGSQRAWTPNSLASGPASPSTPNHRVESPLLKRDIMPRAI